MIYLSSLAVWKPQTSRVVCFPRSPSARQRPRQRQQQRQPQRYNVHTGSIVTTKLTTSQSLHFDYGRSKLYQFSLPPSDLTRMDEALKLWTKFSFRAGTLAHSFGADIYHNWTGGPEFRFFHFPFRNWCPPLISKPGLATDR
jgi:hypothetical protein